MNTRFFFLFLLLLLLLLLLLDNQRTTHRDRRTKMKEKRDKRCDQPSATMEREFVDNGSGEQQKTSTNV
jgi:hypothetical protein